MKLLAVLFFVTFLCACGPSSRPRQAPALVIPEYGKVSLSWDAVTEPTLVGYKIYYRTATETYTSAQVIDVGNTTTTVVSSLPKNTQYYFVVTAYSSTLESNPSNEVSTFPKP